MGSNGSGIVQGMSTSGSDLSDRVSPVSARLSRPIAQMSPATTDGAGRCCFPSGNDKVPMRSSSSWSAWLFAVPKKDEKWPDTCTVASGRGPGEHPDQADPADVRVRRSLHHLSEQRAVGIAGQAVARCTLWT